MADAPKLPSGVLTSSPLPQKIRGTTSALKAASTRTTAPLGAKRPGGVKNMSKGPAPRRVSAGRGR